MTFTRATHDKLRQVQSLLRHQIPTGDVAAVLERGIDVLLRELLKAKTAQVHRPRTPKPANERSRHIPSHVKRAVWARDGGAWVFTAAGGRRCGEQGRRHATRAELDLGRIEPGGNRRGIPVLHKRKRDLRHDPRL